MYEINLKKNIKKQCWKKKMYINEKEKELWLRGFQALPYSYSLCFYLIPNT